MPTTQDRIEKQVILKAPPARVWQAISNAEEFGQWFGVDYAGKEFVPGKDTGGQITNPGYTHVRMNITIEKMVAGKLFSFRWLPGAVEEGRDYSNEPKTLVEFTIEPHGEGTLLKVTESGFENTPADRRDQAFRGNEEGWAAQMEQIRKHLDG